MRHVKLIELIKANDAFVRNLADRLRKVASEVDHGGDSSLTIDCSDITFFSRAFAHEVVSITEDCSRQGIKIIFSHVSPNVSAMLEGVKGHNHSDESTPHRPDLFPRRVAFESVNDLDECSLEAQA